MADKQVDGGVPVQVPVYPKDPTEHRFADGVPLAVNTDTDSAEASPSAKKTAAKKAAAPSGQTAESNEEN